MNCNCDRSTVRTTGSPAQTEALGHSLGEKMQPGDIVLLYGNLGAGKTAFVRGLAHGMGIIGPITSPTYTLLHHYEGAFTLNHLDLYRIENSEALYAAGLDEYIGPPAVTVIEWPERALDALPSCRLEIRIAYGMHDNERTITLTATGGFREVLLD